MCVPSCAAAACLNVLDIAEYLSLISLNTVSGSLQKATTPIYRYTHTRTHTHTRERARAHTHTHTHTLSLTHKICI